MGDNLFMEKLLRVGVITTTHGVRGEVKVYPTTDDPQRFKKLKKVEYELLQSKTRWLFLIFKTLTSSLYKLLIMCSLSIFV